MNHSHLVFQGSGFPVKGKRYEAESHFQALKKWLQEYGTAVYNSGDNLYVINLTTGYVKMYVATRNEWHIEEKTT